MRIDDNTLPSMERFGAFQEIFEVFAKEVCWEAVLAPKISLPRLKDAHYAWRDDIVRVKNVERKLTRGLDHFKLCGHLAYWLRRMSPIVEYVDLAAFCEDLDELYADEKAARRVLSAYGTEYVAFDFGLQICRYYEAERIDGDGKEKILNITEDYIIDICHLLKFKHASPHSIAMIYRSVLL